VEEKKENEKKEKQRKANIQEESKKMLFDMVRKEEEVKDEQKSDEEDMPDDTDGKNEAEEYELWRIRELKRHRRDKSEREARALEKADIERRRNMTDEERKKEDEKLAKKQPKREKAKKFEFMQKYFHRGAYFQDKAVDGSEPLYLRDFHEGTAWDKVDKSALPEVMQLRRGLWGMKGQVKHTHLSAEDTTNKSSLVSQMDEKLASKMHGKMAGVKGKDSMDRPTARGI
jgi:microfibrillar-associated protein 1